LGPEYLERGIVTPLIDQYSLGVVAKETIRKTNLGVLCPFGQGAWNSVLERATDHDPAKRYGTCGEFVHNLSAGVHRELVTQLRDQLKTSSASMAIRIEPNIPDAKQEDARVRIGLSRSERIIAVCELESEFRIKQLRKVLTSGVVFTERGCHVFGWREGKEDWAMLPYPQLENRGGFVFILSQFSVTSYRFEFWLRTAVASKQVVKATTQREVMAGPLYICALEMAWKWFHFLNNDNDDPDARFHVPDSFGRYTYRLRISGAVHRPVCPG
jgi:hypothetical protein